MGPKQQPQKSSSTLDLLKNGMLNAKKRLLSADKMDYDESPTPNKDDPYSPYSPTTPENTSPHSHSSNKSESPNKKSIFSKGKGLFGRRESTKDIHTDSDDQKGANKHNKSASKSNLSNFKAKLQNMKNKAYGSQTALAQTNDRRSTSE